MTGKPRLTAKKKKQMKTTLCELLGKSPIIEIACQKVGISRMTLSRWRKKDKKFSQKIDDVLEISRESINDLAESKMIQLIGEGNTRMIFLWLAHNCPRYKKEYKEVLPKPQPIIFSVPRSPFMTGEGKYKKDP